jgi:DNA-3-methyladenine glycosylase II
MPIFKYGKTEIVHLQNCCPVLGGAIERIGKIKRAVEPDLFKALVHSIVSQQISAKALATIWSRMQERFSPMTPETISVLNIDAIQQCGISLRKASYIQEAAEKVRNGELDFNRLPSLSDNEICTELVRFKGIGVWTAEMLMIFSMQRPNVLSWGDLAIHRGLRILYRHRIVTEKLFEKYRKRFSPYASVASLYLWAIAGGACEELTDPAVPKLSKQK